MRQGLLLGCCLLAAASARAAAPVEPAPALAIAPALAPAPAPAPAPAIALTGRGVQIYTCAQTAAGPAWRLKAPDAALLDAAGHVAGHHFAGAPFAGPTWRAADGSSVTAARLAESPSPAAGAIPWLILRATAHGGAGVFAAVAYIVRSQTEGGAAPKAGCDAAHRDAETRVPYSATYSFFPG